MADTAQLRNPLMWEGNPWNRAPVWPRDPDVAVMKALVLQHLGHALPDPPDDTLLEVTLFAEGAFNRLYVISYAGHAITYMFRVALPVIPFFKTESEVATLAYLRAKTSIPVPRVHAWDSSAKNNLGFEWIIMERVGGVALRDVWRKIPWERKLGLVDEIAEFVQQLRTQTFDAIGSLYFKSALAFPRDGKGDILREEAVQDDLPEGDRKDKTKDVDIQSNFTTAPSLVSEPQHSTKPEADHHKSMLPRGSETNPEVNSKDNASEKYDQTKGSSLNQGEQEFGLGPLFSSLFFLGCRLYLPGNRGPYQKCSEWLQAQIQIQQTLAETGLPEGDPGYDSDFEEEAPNMIKTCQQLRQVLPAIIPEYEDEVVAVPHHHDMNGANILVDPETFAITGIVDWELINIQPIWISTDYPDFLKFIEPQQPEEPPIPNYDIEDDGLGPIEIRDRWDYQLLRNRFDDTIGRLSGGAGFHEILESAEIKRDFVDQISNITEEPLWVKHWLERHLADETESDDEEEVEDESDNVEDGAPSGETDQVNSFTDEASHLDIQLHKSDIMTDRNEHDLPEGPKVDAMFSDEVFIVESDQGEQSWSRLFEQKETSTTAILQGTAMD